MHTNEKENNSKYNKLFYTGVLSVCMTDRIAYNHCQSELMKCFCSKEDNFSKKPNYIWYDRPTFGDMRFSLNIFCHVWSSI